MVNFDSIKKGDSFRSHITFLHGKKVMILEKLPERKVMIFCPPISRLIIGIEYLIPVEEIVEKPEL